MNLLRPVSSTTVFRRPQSKSQKPTNSHRPAQHCAFKPSFSLEDVPKVLDFVKDHLQTVALEGLGSYRRTLAEMLGQMGVTRITSFEEAPWPPPWWHHDGASVFEGMVRWIDLEEASD